MGRQALTTKATEHKRKTLLNLTAYTQGQPESKEGLLYKDFKTYTELPQQKDMQLHGHSRHR